MRPSVRPTTAWTTRETTTRATCTSPEHGRRARTLVHLFILSHTSLAQGSRSESCHFISIVIHERTSLSRFSSSTSICPSLSSSFPSTSCTASCTLSSTTWSPWKACATPPTREWRRLRRLHLSQTFDRRSWITITEIAALLREQHVGGSTWFDFFTKSTRTTSTVALTKS